VSVYLDACVLVSLFTRDIQSLRAAAFLRQNSQVLLVSDFAAAEFSSALARQVRMKLLTAGNARQAFGEFDVWARQFSQRVETNPADVITTDALLRRLEFPLRTSDALNLAIVMRLNATLLTFDANLHQTATKLGIAVAQIS
jgi:predicted nucleic acid-binding protein